MNAENKTIYVINGPNLNLLGTREPEIYGSTTLVEINKRLEHQAKSAGVSLRAFQSNSEGEIVNLIQEAALQGSGLILNAAAYTHTSIAIHDALLCLNIPVIEVHLSNIFRREEFRAHSFVSLAADAVICGLGSLGYELALQAILEKLS